MESSLQLPEQARERAGFPWQAFGTSLLLHVLVVAAVAPGVDLAPASTVTDPGALTAVLQPPVPISVSSAVPPAPTFSPSKPTRLRQVETLTPPPDDPPRLTQRMSAQSPVASEPPAIGRKEGRIAAPPADQPLGGEAGGVQSQRFGAEPLPALPTAEARAAGPDAAGLRQYRLTLAGEAKRFRRYPEMARRTGLSGTAEVRVVVTAGSGGRQASLNRSSGHAVLDEVALEILRLAVERAELPASLRGQSFAVLLPVVFEVED
jgi:protein TonB